MVQTLSISLQRPIESVSIINSKKQKSAPLSNQQIELNKEIQKQSMLNDQLQNEIEKLQRLNQTLHSTVDQCKNYQQGIFSDQKGDIAELAVLIAEKILCHKISEKEYQIHNIIKQALENTPTRKDIVVHLNPEDLTQCQQKTPEILQIEGAQFISDANIAPAECKIETPKGIVETFIEHQLKNLEQMLKNT